MRTREKRKGFTLVELITVLAIITLLAMVGAPEFFSWLPNMRLRSAASDMASDMQRAKAEAVKRNSNVVVVLNNVARPGLPSAVPSPGGGYQIFIDNGAGGGTAADSIKNGGELEIANVTMPKDVAFCAKSFGGNTGFDPKGLLITNTGTMTLNNNKSNSNILTLTIAGGIQL